MDQHIRIRAMSRCFDVFLIALLFLSSFSVGCIPKANPRMFDFTDRSSEIVSISYVEVTCLEYSRENDVFEYRVLETIDAGEKDRLLSDLSGLEYYFRPEPHSLSVGDHGILLCFKDSVELHYVLYCRSVVTDWRRTKTGDDYQWAYGETDLDAWNNLLDRYLKQDHGLDQYSR